MKKTLIPEGTPLFENIARNQIPEILESLSAVTCLPACIHASTGALCLLARHGDYAPEDIEPLYVRPCDAVDNLPDLARRQGRDSDAATAELERLLHLAPDSEI